MGSPVNDSQIPRGTLFEYRLARLRFSQGYFVRRSIDLWPEGLDGNKLAELDCLAIAFDPQLRQSLEVIECKASARGQGEIDRLIWLKGMGAYTRARTVTLAKQQLAVRSREFARQLGVQWLDDAGIAAAEDAMELPADWWPGFHNPEFGERIVKPARAALNGSPDLKRAGKYLFGSFWFTDDFTRIKQLHTLFRLLTKHPDTLHPQALLLGVGEATTLFALTALSIASLRNQLVEADFHRLVLAELSSGLGDPRSLRRLLRQVDELQYQQIDALHAAYQQTGAGRLVFPTRNLEAEILTPPEWIDAFVNVISRLAIRRHLATDVMYWIDMWAAGLLGASQEQLAVGQVKAALDLVFAFLTRHWGVPEKFLQTLPAAKPAREHQLTIDAAMPRPSEQVAGNMDPTPLGAPAENHAAEPTQDVKGQSEQGVQRGESGPTSLL